MGEEIVARRIVYSLIPAAVMLFAGGAALGQGMKTFKTEQAAQRHCPADTIVWLNTASASYHYKGDPWYGRTQRGTYVCKVEADKDGMREWTSSK
jgi:hypothetical protein